MSDKKEDYAYAIYARDGKRITNTSCKATILRSWQWLLRVREEGWTIRRVQIVPVKAKAKNKRKGSK